MLPKSGGDEGGILQLSMVSCFPPSYKVQGETLLGMDCHSPYSASAVSPLLLSLGCDWPWWGRCGLLPAARKQVGKGVSSERNLVLLLLTHRPQELAVGCRGERAAPQYGMKYLTLPQREARLESEPQFPPLLDS